MRTPHKMSARNEADRICDDMAEGEERKFSGRFFREAYPKNPITGAPTLDRFLESRIAANYGAWRVRHDFVEDTYTVSRHPVGRERVREDFDRR